MNEHTPTVTPIKSVDFRGYTVWSVLILCSCGWAHYGPPHDAAAPWSLHIYSIHPRQDNT